MIVPAVRDAARHTFVYSHRSERLEHWAFLLFTAICVAIFYALGTVGWNTVFPVNWLFVLLFCWLVLANVAVAVRRLHDHGVSGFWLFVPLVPVGTMLFAAKDLFGNGVGFLTEDQALLLFRMSQGALVTALVVFGSLFVRPGDRKPNRFGPAP